METKEFQKTVLEELKSIKSDIKSVKDDVRLLKTQTTENTQMLKALQYSAEVNKAEHEQMMTRLDTVQGTLSGLRKDLSTMEVVTANNYADIAKLKAVK